MEVDTEKIEEEVLALLYLPRCDVRSGGAAWKSHDWDALNQLHEKGYIGNPVSKSKSVGFSLRNHRKLKPAATSEWPF